MMRILRISDTYSRHSELRNLPEADVLVHTGNFTLNGRQAEVFDFMEWLYRQPYKYKVFIAGKHDTWLYKNELNIREPNCYNLRYSSVEIEGILFHGIPTFEHDLGEGGLFQKALAQIPQTTDALISNVQLTNNDFRLKPRLCLYGSKSKDWSVYELNKTSMTCEQ